MWFIFTTCVKGSPRPGNDEETQWLNGPCSGAQVHLWEAACFEWHQPYRLWHAVHLWHKLVFPNLSSFNVATVSGLEEFDVRKERKTLLKMDMRKNQVEGRGLTKSWGTRKRGSCAWVGKGGGREWGVKHNRVSWDFTGESRGWGWQHLAAVMIVFFTSSWILGVQCREKQTHKREDMKKEEEEDRKQSSAVRIRSTDSKQRAGLGLAGKGI